jgi:hypothetical protein
VPHELDQRFLSSNHIERSFAIRSLLGSASFGK